MESKTEYEVTKFPEQGDPVPLSIMLSIAYTPETGEIVIDGSFKGGADGRMLLEMAAAQLAEAYPRP